MSAKLLCLRGCFWRFSLSTGQFVVLMLIDDDLPMWILLGHPVAVSQSPGGWPRVETRRNRFSYARSLAKECADFSVDASGTRESLADALRASATAPGRGGRHREVHRG